MDKAPDFRSGDCRFESLNFHLTVRDDKGFGQKYIKKLINYQYMAMGHVPPN